MDTSPTESRVVRQGRPVPAVIGAIRRLNRGLHFVAGLMLVALMLVTVADVIGRTLFNSPFPGTVELTEMVMVAIIYLGFANAEDEGEHIAVDILFLKLGWRSRLAVTVFSAVFGIVVVGLLTWKLYDFSLTLNGGGYTTAVLNISQGPVALIAVGGAFMFVLALAATGLLALRALKDEET